MRQGLAIRLQVAVSRAVTDPPCADVVVGSTFRVVDLFFEWVIGGSHFCDLGELREMLDSQLWSEPPQRRSRK